MSTSSHGCAACARDLWHIDCRTAVVAGVGVAEIDTAELSRMILDAEKRGRAEVVTKVEKACGKAEALTQDAIGHVSEHWRGRDYADGLDAGIETTAGLVRDALVTRGGTK